MGISLNDVSGIGAVSDLIKDVADKIWPDPAKKAEAMLKVQELDNQLAQGQLAIDAAEAANENMFVSGWRPFIGWVCGLGFAYHVIFQPLITYICAMVGHPVTLPFFDSQILSDTMFGMLGFGSMRTVEKLADKGHLPWQK